jgi:hypothetical protein
MEFMFLKRFLKSDSKPIGHFHYLVTESPLSDGLFTYTSCKYGQVENELILQAQLTKELPVEAFDVVNIFTNKISNEVQISIENMKLTIKFISLNKNINKNKDTAIYKLVLNEDEKKPAIISTMAITHLNKIPKVTFIIGSHRSGTTVMGLAIQKIFGQKFHNECHVAPLFEKLVQQAKSIRSKSPNSKKEGVLLSQIMPVEIEVEFHKMIRNIYSSFYGDNLIIDKTPGPEMLSALPFMLKVFPNAKVIFCKRRGIENVESRMRRFPSVKFNTHCSQWSRNMSEWRRIKEIINEEFDHSDWFCEVEQYNLQFNPQKEVKKLEKLLDLNNKQKVQFINILKNKSPQQTSKPSKASCITNNSWTDEQREIFVISCAKEMELFNYSMNENYFLNNGMNF